MAITHRINLRDIPVDGPTAIGPGAFPTKSPLTIAPSFFTALEAATLAARRALCDMLRAAPASTWRRILWFQDATGLATKAAARDVRAASRLATYVRLARQDPASLFALATIAGRQGTAPFPATSVLASEISGYARRLRPPQLFGLLYALESSRSALAGREAADRQVPAGSALADLMNAVGAGPDDGDLIVATAHFTLEFLARALDGLLRADTRIAMAGQPAC
jgi:hypothetical protein